MNFTRCTCFLNYSQFSVEFSLPGYGIFKLSFIRLKKCWVEFKSNSFTRKPNFAKKNEWSLSGTLLLSILNASNANPGTHYRFKVKFKLIFKKLLSYLWDERGKGSSAAETEHKTVNKSFRYWKVKCTHHDFIFISFH